MLTIEATFRYYRYEELSADARERAAECLMWRTSKYRLEGRIERTLALAYPNSKLSAELSWWEAGSPDRLLTFAGEVALADVAAGKLEERVSGSVRLSREDWRVPFVLVAFEGTLFSQLAASFPESRRRDAALAARAFGRSLVALRDDALQNWKCDRISLFRRESAHSGLLYSVDGVLDAGGMTAKERAAILERDGAEVKVSADQGL